MKIVNKVICFFFIEYFIKGNRIFENNFKLKKMCERYFDIMCFEKYFLRILNLDEN